MQQESPPAWTQEAYRPRRIKYSICFPKWGTPSRSNWGRGIQGGVPPGRGFPQPGLMGGTQGRVPPPARVPPGQVRWGYLRQGTPGQAQQGVPEVGMPWQVCQGVPKVGYLPSRGTPPPTWLDLAGVPPRRCGLTTNKVKLLPPVSYYLRGRQLWWTGVNDYLK